MILSSKNTTQLCNKCSCETVHKVEIGYNKKRLKLGTIELTEEVTTCIKCHLTVGRVIQKKIERD